MINHLKRLCVLALLLIFVAYACVALYGQIAGDTTGAFYSEDIDATCVTQRKGAALAMSCMPGDRYSKERDQ